MREERLSACSLAKGSAKVSATRLASPSHGCFILLLKYPNKLARTAGDTKKAISVSHAHQVRQPRLEGKATMATLSKFYPWGPTLSSMVDTNEPTEPRKLPYGRSCT